MTDPIVPGLLVLHGNRLELLQEAVLQWIGARPLGPLEQEIFLVQSNGIAEWLKMSLARRNGVCAAVTMQLPARFLWRAYAQVLGRQRVPQTSPLDKAPLTWRLMRLLPGLLDQPAFAPLRDFLADGDAEKRLQLAERLADIYDQYQVYRADWLADWEAGLDQLRRPGGGAAQLAPAQAWQASLWRALLADIAEHVQRDAGGRAQVHLDFLRALAQNQPAQGRLPRRIVLFGASTLPRQTLEALHALSRRCQVIVAIPNPCQYHWADTIDGRELLRAERRQRLREDRDLAGVPLEDLHAYCNPLLASWGRQGRDFVRLLDAFEEQAGPGGAIQHQRVDLFESELGAGLLAQVQANICNLEPPVAADAQRAADPGDASIVFHVAHSAQREVEILHDQLLAYFRNAAPDTPLAPRDIVVMVPAIEEFAPAIRAVFGQYAPTDPRYIPFDIVDLRARRSNPILVALEWLLRLPTQRCRLSDIQNLLDVPALARRFGLEKGDLERLSQWMAGAGIRWGLSSSHRRNIGLDACGEQNSWLFGLRRMLLGYASGGTAAFAGIEPYDEIGGLDASLAGSLAALVSVLERWETFLAAPRTPAQWTEAARQLLADCFTAEDEAEKLTLAALHSALHQWLGACEEAGFEETVPTNVLREGWLGQVDEPAVSQSFLGRGVTFCTLMPMRAIPFDVVCLLGMNDADYPRRVNRANFDLMALPGEQRPGDRSRRDDDRYLMLEALLSARRTLYVSWSGRSVRDNSTQPPSVLVSQLRDYLAANWADGMLARITVEHPLQPFSTRYFEGGALFTFAREWRKAHQAATATCLEMPDYAPAGVTRLNLATLADFLQNPVRHFFRQRLDVVFERQAGGAEDDESFAVEGLDEYALVKELLDAAPAEAVDAVTLRAVLAQRAASIERAGRLPIGQFGSRARDALIDAVLPVWQQWSAHAAAWNAPAEKEPLHFEHAGVVVEDWLDGLRAQGEARAWLQLSPQVLTARGAPRGDKLLGAWLRQLVGSACGLDVQGIVIGRDAVAATRALDPALARVLLAQLIDTWRLGMQAPLPFACKTAFAAAAAEPDPNEVRQVYEGGYEKHGEVEEPCLARTYPTFEALTSRGDAAGHDFANCVARLFVPIVAWMTSGLTLTPHSGEALQPVETQSL